MNEYDLGDKPRLQATFDISDTETDPTSTVLILFLPDGSYESYLSAAGYSDQGSWNASTNTPTLANPTGTAGHYYTVSTAGTIDFGNGSQTFTTDDYVAYDGDSWLLIPEPQAGTLTNSATGVYLYDYPVHQKGIHVYRFEGTGTVHAADEVRFRVVESSIR